MFGFLKRKNNTPPFRLLWAFEKRTYCFTRNAEWGWLDTKQIFVTVPGNSETIMLVEWEQHLFLAAGGQQTVIEFVYATASLYMEQIPGTLDQVIIDALLQLHDRQLIVFTPHKQTVPAAFDQPGLKG